MASNITTNQNLLNDLVTWASQLPRASYQQLSLETKLMILAAQGGPAGLIKIFPLVPNNLALMGIEAQFRAVLDTDFRPWSRKMGAWKIFRPGAVDIDAQLRAYVLKEHPTNFVEELSYGPPVLCDLGIDVLFFACADHLKWFLLQTEEKALRAKHVTRIAVGIDCMCGASGCGFSGEYHLNDDMYQVEAGIRMFQHLTKIYLVPSWNTWHATSTQVKADQRIRALMIKWEGIWAAKIAMGQKVKRWDTPEIVVTTKSRPMGLL